MPTIEPFRAFVNRAGLPIPFRVFDPEATTIPNLFFTRDIIARLYWMLSSVQLQYTYTINDFQISRQFVFDFSDKGIKERMEGPVSDEYTLSDDELEITSTGLFPIAQVCDAEATLPSMPNPFINLNGHLNRERKDKFGLYFHVSEVAYDQSFTFSSTLCTTMNRNSVLLDSYNCRFLGEPLTFRFWTLDPEYTGRIDKVTITPEFLTIAGSH